MTLKEYVARLEKEGQGELLAELETLRKEAEFGRQGLDALRKEAKKTLSILGFTTEGQILEGIVDRMEPGELAAFHKTFSKLAKERYPEKAQIVPAEESNTPADEEYRI